MITLILSLVGWPGSARTIRGMVHAIKREDFIQNSRLEMIPSPVIIFNHIIPQIASLLIVSIALSIPGFIMTETTLSYLGLGIVDPAVSWGSLIKRDISTLSNLQAYPWLLSPVWFLLGITLAFNFLGDALRDYFDPYHTVFRKSGIKKLFRKRSHRGTADTEDTEGNEKVKERNEKSEESRGDSLTQIPPCNSVDSVGSVRDSSCTVRDSSCTVKDSSCSVRDFGQKNLLEVRDLTVKFTVLRGQERVYVQAVRGVSFEVGRGEVLGIVGESGSGKSVSVQAVPGLLPRNTDVTGSVLFDGRELLGLPVNVLREFRGKKIGMIFQEPGRSFDPLQNIGKVFLETFRNAQPKITKEEAAERAAELLAETGLPGGKDRLLNFPHQFSGGQLQRIGIALALAQGCELLIADEPTTALDVTIQKQIVELLKTLRSSRGLSIIFISHDIDLVTGISDRVMVMYGGLVMETLPAQAISGEGSLHPSGALHHSGVLHPYTKALLAASPEFGSHYTKDRLAVIPGRVIDPANPGDGCPFTARCGIAGDNCAVTMPKLAGIPGNMHMVRCLKVNTEDA
ncbi:MAG: dipeptide/oligopeptide/nickel ABC transporter permease/ATP-binding protein, partial [Treponema sp.]|nr:dipeptide/oligopeptide/nickel ABC transporter permease/ATP-binding protein [Treponema sp.]